MNRRLRNTCRFVEPGSSLEPCKHGAVRTATKWRLQAPALRTTLGFASTIVLRRGSGRCSWFSRAEGNQTEIQETISEEIFAERQDNED